MLYPRQYGEKPKAVAPRASDAVLPELCAFAINDLTQLITEAVRLGDDDLVRRLDAVLRRVEEIDRASSGSLRDRRQA